MKPAPPVPTHCQTEWTLLTSGTTGLPKMVVHSLSGLTAAIKAANAGAEPTVWATFYDIRRYGGLQIFLRAILGGASLVLSDAERAGRPTILERLGAHGVTHISGTPSHWRRVLMSPAARAIAPRYVRLSGEIADQAILDNLRALLPAAPASATPLRRPRPASGSRSTTVSRDFRRASSERAGRRADEGRRRLAAHPLEPHRARAMSAKVARALADADGFVDTGDIVERRGDRYYFVGRRGGIINVGGLKVHPEEVEAVINRHPDVRMSLVRPKRIRSPGPLSIADVVLNGATSRAGRAQV